jgi:hypothetical protein
MDPKQRRFDERQQKWRRLRVLLFLDASSGGGADDFSLLLDNIFHRVFFLAAAEAKTIALGTLLVRMSAAVIILEEVAMKQGAE